MKISENEKKFSLRLVLLQTVHNFSVLKVKRRVRLEGAELEDHMKKEKEKEAEMQRIKMEQARR